MEAWRWGCKWTSSAYTTTASFSEPAVSVAAVLVFGRRLGVVLLQAPAPPGVPALSGCSRSALLRPALLLAGASGFDDVHAGMDDPRMNH